MIILLQKQNLQAHTHLENLIHFIQAFFTDTLVISWLFFFFRKTPAVITVTFNTANKLFVAARTFCQDYQTVDEYCII